MGTRLRHFKSANLKELEAFIQALSFKIEIKQVQKVAGQWYVHFTVGDFTNIDPQEKLLAKKGK